MDAGMYPAVIAALIFIVIILTALAVYLITLLSKAEVDAACAELELRHLRVELDHRGART